MTIDTPMDHVMAAVAALHAGDRAGARARFIALWEDIEVCSHPARRCIIAHYAADAQESLEQELAWDQRALAAAEEAPEAEIVTGGAILSVRVFLPSLHLNLGDAYRRSGLLPLAREQAIRAREATIALPDDGYGATVRAAIERLSERLAVAT